MRKSSASKGRRKSTSAKRRKATPERLGAQETQAYELFANRHLRRINDVTSGVNVNTKYELTAANTSKLWSKFEEELLGRQYNRNPPAAEAAK